ncbi:uncharacterized protein LOC130048773 [Ostrea edulis]|uniref:uncharacterized protein LOC130048773 n=1 Tax=Ostrea edulis TaxID=37623 RepID=UPI0024AF1C7C|nr:uncharacterized protein LOC130048773 [Ostrea edulis]
MTGTVRVKWPKGTYTLVKPKSGCPSGWLEGWRNQDNEDYVNRNSVTYNADNYQHHFFGIDGTHPKNINISYCTKDPNDVNEEGNWPKGSYCILKHGSTCPDGAFQSGYVIWDDEDSNNENSKGGELPSGSFDWNTRIDYCCRSDSPFYTGIQLPTSKPFYLLKHKDSHFCPSVIGMSVREEYVYTDDENDDNINSVHGSHPYGPFSGGRNHKLYYCYYWSH